jgi:hypothetical protein
MQSMGVHVVPPVAYQISLSEFAFDENGVSVL